MRYLIFLVSLLWAEAAQTQNTFQPYPEVEKRLVQSISFSPTGDTLYFSLMHREYLESKGMSVDDTTPILAIYMARKSNSGWSEPELMPFSGKYKDYEPSLSPDGNLLFFNSWRPVDNIEISGKNNVWYARKENGRWKEAQHLDGINTLDFEESYPTITKDGNLYFTAGRMVNGKEEYAVYHTKFGEMPVEISKVEVLDIPQGTGDPCVSPDHSFIIFTKFNPEDWYKTCDLYISHRENNTWSVPKALEGLNSDGPDYAAALSPDEKWLYYRRNSKFIRVPLDSIFLKQSR